MPRMIRRLVSFGIFFAVYAYLRVNHPALLADDSPWKWVIIIGLGVVAFVVSLKVERFFETSE